MNRIIHYCRWKKASDRRTGLSVGAFLFVLFVTAVLVIWPVAQIVLRWWRGL